MIGDHKMLGVEELTDYPLLHYMRKARFHVELTEGNSVRKESGHESCKEGEQETSFV
jgi:hypothetical protein